MGDTYSVLREGDEGGADLISEIITLTFTFRGGLTVFAGAAGRVNEAI